jgi:excisionase family DNA binding protein
MAALMVDEEMLTVEEACKRLKLHEETVRRWIRTGRLRATRLGFGRAGYRIPASEVERILRGERAE